MPEFLRPRLIGPRFEDGKIPLEMLSDLSVLREMVIEVAKWQYLKDNPNRTRSPKRFADSIALTLSSVEKGSVIPVIDVEFHTTRVLGAPELPGMPGSFDRYFEEARDAIIDAIAEAEGDGSTPSGLPDKCFEYFDRIGRWLSEDESVEFVSPVSPKQARLTKESRRRLVLASQIEELTEEVRLRGSIPEADQDRMSFELLLQEGRKIPATMDERDLDVVLEVFNDYNNSRKALISGIGKYNRQGRLTKLASIVNIVILDPLDVPSRLEELRNLSNGWLDGEGIAPPAKFLDWLSQRFELIYPDELPLPHMYPTPEGGIQAEWSLPDCEASLEINPNNKVGEWHVLDRDTDEDALASLDLGDDKGWMELIDRIRSLSEASA